LDPEDPTITGENEGAPTLRSTVVPAIDKPKGLRRIWDAMKPKRLQRILSPTAHKGEPPLFLIRQLPLDDVNARGYNLTTDKWIMPNFPPWKHILTALIKSMGDDLALETEADTTTAKLKGKQRDLGKFVCGNPAHLQ
jgi:hypothetical protein